jgi:hypothetical protein
MFFKKKNPKKRRRRRRNMLGWLMGWFGHPVWIFFKKNKIKYVMGVFWGKKVEVVKLQQFESLGELNVTFETFEVKMQIGG